MYFEVQVLLYERLDREEDARSPASSFSLCTVEYYDSEKAGGSFPGSMVIGFEGLLI